MKKTSMKSVACVARDGTPGKIEYGLRYIDGNPDSHFSVTAWFKGKDKDGNRSEFGGACHDEILAIRPDLKPLVDLHLSAEDGWPMHLSANAASHAGIGKWSKFAPQWLASHLRVSVECAEELARDGDVEKLRAFIDSQTGRYEREAKQAIAQFELR